MPCSTKKPTFRIAFLLAVTLLVFWSLKAGAQDPAVSISEQEQKWLSEHPILEIGVGVAFPPYMWVEKKDGEHIFKGMVSDYVDLLSERLGVDMKIVFGIPFNEALDRGRTGRIDLFPCLSKTPERAQFLLFTEPYLSYPLVIITREGAPILGGVKDLKGKRLALVKHLFVYSKIQNDYPNLDLNYVFTDKVEENLEAVSLGRADACIINLAAASYYIQKKGLTNLRIAASVNWKAVQLAMGVRKDWPILQGIIEKALASISQEEKDRISQRWVRAEYEPAVAIGLIWRWSLGIGLGVAVLFGLVFIWNRRLQKEIDEKEKAEYALKESERKLSTLIGNLPGIVYRCLNDKDWTMLYISNGCKFLTGYEPSEIIESRTLAYNDLIVEEDRQHVWNEIQMAIDENRPFTIEYRIRDKNKNERWVWEKGRSVAESKGDKCILEGFISDITERKEAEESLRKSEEQLGLAMEFANDGLYDWNLKTNQIYYSPVWKRLLGYNDNEIKNEFFEWERLTKPEDIEASWTMLNELLEGKRNRFETEFQMLHKDGHWVDILSRANVLFDENGQGVRVVGTHVDITERKMAEREILQQKQKAERYLNLAGVMFIGLDRGGNVNIANKKACSILECNETDIIGQNWFDNFIPQSIRRNIHSVFQQLISGNVEPVEYYENPIISKSNREKHIAWHNTYITDDAGKITGILGSGEDITEKRLLEAQLQHAQKIEAIGTLAGGIAHDFNNILGIILGNTELAMDDVPKWNPASENLNEVKKACLRAKDVVRQILSFSRKSEAEQKPFSIASVVAESLKLLRASIPTSIDLRQNIPDNILEILGDSTLIHQIMINLCTNAAHAMKNDEGILEVTLTNKEINRDTASKHPGVNPGSYVHLHVSDTGEGISPEIIDRIFDPYFTTKDVDKGTGLGLSVVHGIVNSHNGRISVESEIGKGTTFNILFPAFEGEGKEEPKEFLELPSGRERILFIDDEDSLVKLNQQRLERLGYTVTGKTDPSEALEFFRTNPDQIDLIITDMTMPKITGDKLVQAILEIRRDTPIILCTGYSQKISKEKAQKLGIRKYIEKPIEMENLARSIREVLDGQ